MIDCISKNVYLNNEITSSENVLNAEFESHTTIYEVIRIIKQKALFVEDHLTRLQKSADLLKLQLPFSIDNIAQKINQFIRNENIIEGNVKIECSYNFDYQRFLLYQIKHSYPIPQMYIDGVKTSLLQIERSNPNAKNIQPFHITAQKFIKEHQLFEAILVDFENNITEGSKSNIFFIRNNELITALPEDVLLGITRKYIINISKQIGMTVVERKVSKEELKTFDAAFISGTSPKVLPIKNIDNYTLNTQNYWLKNIIESFNNEIEKYIAQ